MPIKGRLYPSHYSLLYYVKGEKPKTFKPDRLPMEVCGKCFNEIKDYGGYKNKMNPLGITFHQYAIQNIKQEKMQMNYLSNY